MIQTPSSSLFSPAKDGNRYRILAVVLTGLFIGVLDVQVVSLALPTITRFFAAPLSLTQWVSTGYVIAATSTVLIFGAVSRFYGAGRLFRIGLLIFTLASLACGLSASLPVLIGCRVIQATGASLMLGVSIAIIMQVFPREELGRAMGYYTAVIALGLIIGPAVGGFILDTAGWPAIFLVNIPLGLVLSLAAARYLKIDGDPGEPVSIDYPGALLLIVFMSLLSLLLSSLAALPVDLLRVSIFVVGLLLTGAAFFFWEQRTPRPIIPITPLARLAFFLPAISLILYMAATFLLITIQPFYFEEVMGMRPSQVGLIALILPVAMIIASPVSGWVYDTRHPRNYPLYGLIVMGMAFIGCGFAFSRISLPEIIICFIITGIARPVFQGPNSIEIMGALPGELRGLGSGLITTLQNLGIMSGIFLATTLLTIEGPTGSSPSLAGFSLSPAFGKIMFLGGVIYLATGLLNYRRKNVSE